MTFNIICAYCQNRGIGFNGTIPWILRKDMAQFSKLTKSSTKPNSINAVIMGRKTWISLPEKFKPLPGRINIILSRDENFRNSLSKPNVISISSLDAALKYLEPKQHDGTIDLVWIIGGVSLYKEAINSQLCSHIYLTEIKKLFTCDVFFPHLPDNFKQITIGDIPNGIQIENGIEFEFKVYKNVQITNTTPGDY